MVTKTLMQNMKEKKSSQKENNIVSQGVNILGEKMLK